MSGQWTKLQKRKGTEVMVKTNCTFKIQNKQQLQTKLFQKNEFNKFVY